MDVREMICKTEYPVMPKNLTKGNLIHEDVMQMFMTQIFSNPVFSGGAMLSVVGFFWYIINYLWSLVKSLFRQKYFSTLELTNENVTYKYVIEHINKNSSWETRNLSVETTLNRDEDGPPQFMHKLVPGIGAHFFYYKDRVIYFQRNRQSDQSVVPDIQGGRAYRKSESIFLQTYRGSPEFWKQFLNDASSDCLDKLDKGLPIYTASQSSYWEMTGNPRKRRPLETVILDDGLAEKICADLETFISSADWYQDRGIPYRRGYLLYGPPGTGKSSFIAALASHFGYGISALSLTSSCLTDSNLQSLINGTPSKTFLLIEDIDVAFKNREDKENKNHENSSSSSNGITLSGLLNALDGIASAEKRILFMTTNFKENLDAALIRPGRADVQIRLGHCTPTMTKKMFQRFYENSAEELANEFTGATSKLEKSFSPAQLQQHLIVHKDSAKAAIENVQDLQ